MAYDYTKDDYYSPFYEAPEPAITGAPVVDSSRFSQSYQGGLNATITGPSVEESQPAISGGSSSGGGYARAYPVGTTSISENILPDESAPTLDLPDFSAPEWDEDKISELSRKAAGPYVSGLRRGLNRTLVAIRSSEKNPAARAQMYRQALEGFGGESGLGGVLARARRQGRAEYGQQYAYDFQEAVRKTEQLNQEKLANFNAAMMIYNSKIKQKSTSSTSYSTSPTSYSASESNSGVSPNGISYTTGAPRRLSGGMVFGGESMANFINPKGGTALDRARAKGWKD